MGNSTGYFSNRIVVESATGKLNTTSTPALPAVPAVKPDLNSLQKAVDAMKHTMDVREGRAGSVMDQSLTLRSLLDMGVISLNVGGERIVGDLGGTVVVGGGGGGGVTVGGPGGGAPGYTDPRPVLTVPPTPTALTVFGAFKNIVLTWSLLDYRNHSHVEIWRSTSNALGTAVLSGTSTANIYDDASGTLGVTYYYWVRAVNIETVEGAYNAVGGTSGGLLRIGTTDLGPLVVTAANLAAGSVTADKALLELGGDNLVGNNSFEVDANADGMADGWTLYNNSPSTEPATAATVAGRLIGVAQRITWSGTNSTTKGVYNTSGLLRGNWQANHTYVVSWYARANTAKSSGMTLAWNINPTTQTAIKNPSLQTAWQRYAYRITWGASVEPGGNFYATIAGAETGYIEFDDFQIEDGDTLSGYSGKLAVNTIVAGDGAIANLAITNALIGNAAIDDAKIANLSANKVTFGTMSGDRIAVNTLNADRILANSITAGKIAANTITGDRIAANTVTASNVNGYNLTVTGGAITGWAWPPAGSGPGFYLGGNGLLMGNYNDGRFFQIYSNGDVVAPAFSIVSGSATFAGALSAVTGSFGDVTVGSGGAVRSGQTAFNTGIGFYLGTPGGVPKLSIGNPAGEHLNWDGSTLSLTDPTFGPFTVSIPGGNITAINRPTGTLDYGTRTVSVSGGKAPYTYMWVMSNGAKIGSVSFDNAMSSVWIAGGTSTSATVSIHGYGNGATNTARLICFVMDVNGRATFASVTISYGHLFTSGGGTGGSGDGGP